MAYLGLLMFLLGLWTLYSEYFGEKPRKREEPVNEADKKLESNLHIGIVKTWGAVIIGLLFMLLSPWNCNGM
jgi:hypothetical protein